MPSLVQDIQSAIIRNPLIVAPDMNVIEAIAAMGKTDSRCVLVVEEKGVEAEDIDLLGILTQRDIIRISSKGKPFEQLPIQQVMSHPVISIQESELTDIKTALSLFKEHSIHHLPVLEGDRIVGLLAQESLAEMLAQSVLQLESQLMELSNQKAVVEHPLENNDAQNRALLAAIPDMMFCVGADGVYRKFMTPNRDIDVVPQDFDPVGKWMHDFLPTDLAQRQQSSLEKALETGKLQVYEQEIQIGEKLHYEEVRVIKSGKDEVLFMVRDITESKQAEIALKQSEETNRAFLAAIPDLLVRMDCLGNYYAMLAGSGIKIKFPTIAVTQPNLYDMLPKALAEERLRYARQAIDTGELQIYEQILEIDNETQYEEVRIVALNNQEVLVMVRNVTDRKIAELALKDLNYSLEAKVAERTAKLRVSEAQNRAIIEAIPDLLLKVNKDGTCVEYIPPLVEPERFEHIGLNLAEILPPDLLQKQLDAITLAISNKELQVYEHQFAIGDRMIYEEVRIIDINSEEALVIVRDISDRKHAESQLKEANEQLAESVINLQRSNALLVAEQEASFDGVLVIDEHRKVVTYNQKLLSLWKTSPELMAKGDDRELINSILNQLTHPTEFLEKVDYLYDHPKEISRDEISLLDGRFFERYSAPIYWSNDSYGRVWFFRDISDRKQSEAQLLTINEQLAVSNQELIRASRLKDEFLSTMSHELRTPLNAILGMTEGLKEEVFGALNPKQIQALTAIDRNGNHLLNLIEDMLDFANIVAGKLKLNRSSTNIQHLCNDSQQLVQASASLRQIQLTSNIQSYLPNQDLDSHRIQQVLVNLLSNAIKFTPEGGAVSMEVSIYNAPDQDDHNSWLRFAVTDTGIGIAPENMSALFQPFTQLDGALNRQYEGTGLGLAIVKQLVEMHGGRVAVRSTIGVGSCFMFDLPLNDDFALLPSSEPVPKLQSSQQEANQSPLLLLAEDNEANIATMESYLEAKGYRVIVARNGQEAIASAKCDRPDLILMDIQMPVMDGLEATKQIRLDPILANIPIIALTALAMAGDHQKCLDAGVNEYISKPVKLSALAQKIQALLTS
ncbi:ATP-binding protein [Pseudanabaena sp. BC1403]|uniref:ATP-binding protein n=1 Tax=Pseudanabaena sp. BC1403 TaxID=2043171 RepID=UPI000CD7FDFA|nr:ATP-binding protein [Pseudanabaena sp. BC1403]